MSTDASTETRRQERNDTYRPDGLPEHVPEPRCRDMIVLPDREDLECPAGTYRVGTVSRREGGEGANYGLGQVAGDAVVNFSGESLVQLWDTDKSALWPIVYTRVDCMKRKRCPETDRISYHGEPLDDGKRRADRNAHAEHYAAVAIATEDSR